MFALPKMSSVGLFRHNAQRCSVATLIKTHSVMLDLCALPFVTHSLRAVKSADVEKRACIIGCRGAYYNAETVWSMAWMWKSARCPPVLQQCHQWAERGGCRACNMEWQQGQLMEIKVIFQILCLFGSLCIFVSLSTREIDEYQGDGALCPFISIGTLFSNPCFGLEISEKLWW